MDIRFMKGDITTVSEGFILHGVNLQNAMGAGVAKAIAEKWPKVKQDYHKAFELLYPTDVIPTLGQVQWIPIGGDLIVANCFTQRTYGSTGIHASLDAIKDCLWICSSTMRIGNWPPEYNRIHLPKIGCGLGGLSWEEEVLPLLEKVAVAYPEITFVVWEL